MPSKHPHYRNPRPNQAHHSTWTRAIAQKLITEARDAVESALLDDLNTPQAIAALSAPLKAMNELLFTKKGKKVLVCRLHNCARFGRRALSSAF